MRFAERGLYVERYVKCANCGVLIYAEDEEIRRGPPDAVEPPESFCSTWCLEWAREREARRAGG